MRSEAGSDTADAVGARGRMEHGIGDLDYLIQRVFTAGVLLGNALASHTGGLAAVERAIGELDDAVRAIPAVGSGLPERCPVCERPVRATTRQVGAGKRLR